MSEGLPAAPAFLEKAPPLGAPTLPGVFPEADSWAAGHDWEDGSLGL